MKYYTPLVLAASLSFSTLLPATAQPPNSAAPQNDLYIKAQASLREKKYPEAVSQAQQVLKMDGLFVSDKIRFLNLAAEATMQQGASHFPAAQKFYEEIVADPAIGNVQKIEAFKGMSEAYIKSLNGQYLDKMDLSPAHDILERALKLPDLNPVERAMALQNIGELYVRQDNMSKAQETYQEVLKLDSSEKTEKSVWSSIADLYVNVGQNDKAVAIYEKHDLDLIALYTRLAEWDKATAVALKVVENPNVSDAERWAAFAKLPAFYRMSGMGRLNGDTRFNPSGFRESLRTIETLSSKYLPAFVEKDPNRALILFSSFQSTPVFDDAFYSRTLVNPGYLVWAAPFLLKANLNDKDYTFVKTKYVDALAALGDDKQVLSETASMLTDPRLSKEVRFGAHVVNDAFSPPTTDIARAVNAEKGLPDGDKAQEIIKAAKAVLAAGKEQEAQKLYAVYEGLLPQQPRAQITSNFVDKAPYSVEGWLSSPILKNKESTAKINRPYGDNLKQLLETDATATGRKVDVSSAKNTGDRDANFHVASDAQGLHLFLDLRDSRAQEVMDGLVRGGSVEMYFAPGEDQPYYTFIPGVPAGFLGDPISSGYGPGSFITMYPNSGWRLPSPEDGTLNTDAQRTNNGFGLALFLSWELFYDKLPTNGTRWQFEAIRWTRSGGLSFGGSQSVHNRSSWGDIVFSGLTNEKLNAIKRNIIFDAVADYRASITGIKSPIGQWNDAELGDPVFYQSQVAPLLARLDAYAARVNKDMTTTDVETIFNEAVPGWIELDFKVAALRKQYLQNKTFPK